MSKSFDIHKKLGRSERSNIQGSVKLRLWLSTREDRGLSEEEDVRNEVKQQQQIFTLLLLSHLKGFKVRTLHMVFKVMVLVIITSLL